MVLGGGAFGPSASTAGAALAAAGGLTDASTPALPGRAGRLATPLALLLASASPRSRSSSATATLAGGSA
eukprot:5795408-Alexandrium_andersonii.AAC.1